MVYIALVLLWA